MAFSWTKVGATGGMGTVEGSMGVTSNEMTSR